MAVYPTAGSKGTTSGPTGPDLRAGGMIGVALLDLSTGEFSAAEYAGAGGMQALADELAVLRPREIIVPGGEHNARQVRGAASPSNGGMLSMDIPPVIASGLPVTPIEGWSL